MNEYVLNHPLITHKLSILRDEETNTKKFREVVTEIAALLCYDATWDARLEEVEIETPIAKMKTGKIREENYAVIPILRAGLGMVHGIIEVMPNAKVGHIGLYRDEDSYLPVEYYYKVPEKIEDKVAMIVDPMLATGGSVIATIDKLKEDGVEHIKFLCIVAAPEGINAIESMHLDVQIFCAVVDDGLNANKYITPGLGDAGDRIFGTK
ncbi:uracil phosphoribosyltransferase [uncultured Methanobrevibacter sp.]|uniref:uracil phosphoribosyltransferase n=1 Tax=uncultured Methanobrevibacter sp. TaxID=253161 RepID=UPI0025DB8034|nr:uracil phosphoribosyltransferase [uncultured Methanobrevibacter sp.]